MFLKKNQSILSVLHESIYYSVHLGTKIECKILGCSNSKLEILDLIIQKFLSFLKYEMKRLI